MAADTPSSAARRWLWLTLVGTGASFALAAALAPPAGATPARGLTWLLLVASSGHVASTGFLFTLAEIRERARQDRGRFVLAPVLLLLAAGSVAALVPASTMAWLLLAYFTWQQWHFQKQNLGLAALAASSQGLSPLRPLERRALMLSGAAGGLGLVANPALLQDGLPGTGSALSPVALILFLVAAVVGAACLLSRDRSDRALGFTLVYLMALLFSAPIFVFDSPYAAVGGLSLAHGAQYLLLVGLISGAEDVGAGRVIKVGVFANVAVIGGGLLNATSHLHDGGTIARFVYGLYLGLVMTHFVMDAAIWRLSDPRSRDFVSARLPYLVRPREGRRSPEPLSGVR